MQNTVTYPETFQPYWVKRCTIQPPKLHFVGPAVAPHIDIKAVAWFSRIIPCQLLWSANGIKNEANWGRSVHPAFGFYLELFYTPTTFLGGWPTHAPCCLSPTIWQRWPSERFHCIQGCREKAAGHVGETAVRRRRKDASAAAQRTTGRCRVESKRDRSLRHKLPSPGTGAASVANRSPRGEELRWHWQGWWKKRGHGR